MRIAHLLLGLAAVSCLSGQPVTMNITADNFYAVYSGNVNAAIVKHFTGAWPTVTSGPVPAVGGYVYVVAWDDGSVNEGLLATIAVGNGYVTTSSPLWQVCATNNKLTGGAASAPTVAALTASIVVCNNSNGWRATSNGPANANAAQANLWGKVAGIDDTAGWIWNSNTTAACSSANSLAFLKGSCDAGEYLIFRIPLDHVRECFAPIPDFSINWTAGYGTLMADGTNSQFEKSYFWSIQESDAWWGLKGPEIMQWFVNQQAGPIDLKPFYEAGGQQLKCDTYYRVKLAVSNQCVGWVDTTKLVKLNCCPGEVK